MKNKMTYIFSCALLAASFFVSSSCTSIHNFAIEIREPAKITFPPNVSKIVVVNNAASSANGNFGTECFFNGKEIDSPFTIKFDSAIWISTLRLTEGIDAEKFFSKAMIYKIPVRTDKTSLEIRLIPETVKQTIFDTSDADAIISIDRCLFKYTQKINQLATGYSLEPYYTFVNTKTIVDLTCSAYLREREKPLTTFMLRDSLFFTEQVSNDSILLFDEIPNLMITEAAAHIGEKAVPYFTPSWKRVDRSLYTSYESRMKEALAYAKADKWIAAENIWLQLYNGKTNHKAQAYLAGNLAVASEIQDDLNKAYDWAQKAEMLFKKENEQKNKPEIDRIKSYILSLTERINNDILLNKQLGIEQSP